MISFDSGKMEILLSLLFLIWNWYFAGCPKYAVRICTKKTIQHLYAR